MDRPLSINLDRLGAELRDEVLQVCRLVDEAGGRAWLVGGSVRDLALGLNVRDIDLEVFHLTDAKLREALQTRYELSFVGQSFGIYKIHGEAIDVGLPRRESKTGRGHKSFEVVADPELDLKDAAARRDYTINAIYFDPLTAQIEDPFGGLADLRDRVLRHTSPAFREDPLRVLRGMQFAARFGLVATEETLKECQSIDLEGLAPERIFGEWEKLILRGLEPSLGLEFLRNSGWIRFFPELENLIGVAQDPRWHPEGDVWVHTLHAMDAFAAERLGIDREDLVVGFAVLCHDLGKPKTTVIDGSKVTSYGHEMAGVALTHDFLGRMTNQQSLVKEVSILVAEHMRPLTLHKDQCGDAAIRRLADRVGRIDRLVRVAKADVLGRPPLPEDPFPAGPWLLARAWSLDVCENAPAPLVQGRHLIELGYSPGQEFGRILARCFEAQLDGTIVNVEQGKDLVTREFGSSGGVA